jgi:hypothetical protein
MTENTSEVLNKLLSELDEESLATMSDEDVLNLRKQLNPYGRTIEGSNNYLTYSYTDLRLDYLKKMITTSMIGFLNRMCDEWHVPDGIPVIPVYDYVKNPEKLDEFENSLQNKDILKADIDSNREYMQKRIIVKEFLEDMFQYNPDTHVRSAYRPNVNDPERSLVNSPAASLAVYNLKKSDNQFAEEWLKYEREQSISGVKPSEKIVTTIRKYCTEMIPPSDIFHRLQYYYDSNYEELKEIVRDLYCDKEEFETAINPYSWHTTEDEADAFINKHKDEVITSIYKAHSGKWNIFAPYKKVRESMRFFNKKTQVLEEIAKQIERDSKLGADLMKKRIKVKKSKNIKEQGPDDPAFLKWKENNATLQEMGGESINAKDYCPDDCPDNAITVPVFRLSKGGTTLEKSHFFTEAEAPTVMEPNK